jgi:hypothetical protein
MKISPTSAGSDVNMLRFELGLNEIFVKIKVLRTSILKVTAFSLQNNRKWV